MIVGDCIMYKVRGIIEYYWIYYGCQSSVYHSPTLPRTTADTRASFLPGWPRGFLYSRKLIGFSPRVEHIFYWPLIAVIYCVSKGGERHLAGVALTKGGFIIRIRFSSSAYISHGSGVAKSLDVLEFVS